MSPSGSGPPALFPFFHLHCPTGPGIPLLGACQAYFRPPWHNHDSRQHHYTIPRNLMNTICIRHSLLHFSLALRPLLLYRLQHLPFDIIMFGRCGPAAVRLALLPVSQ